MGKKMKRAKSSLQETDKDEGKVFFLKTDKGLFPLSDILKIEEKKRAKSQQLKEERKYMEAHGLVSLPFELSTLLLLQENVTYFDASVRQIAQDVVGQGWEVKVKRGKEESEEAIASIQDFLYDPNEKIDEDVGDIVERAIIDWGVVGWYGLEMSRDPEEDDKIDGLWHVPAHTIRVHEDQEKYCQIRNTKKVWFKAYGSEQNISASTGKEIAGKKNVAHEMIFHKRYYPVSDYYGAPAILPSVAALYGIIGVRDYNLAFFENFGIPSAIVVLEGRWSDEAAKEINNFLDTEIKGSANAHKTLVFKLPKGGKATWIPMTEKFEAAFKDYMKILRDEVLVAYKMPPYRIGIAEVGSLGGSTASEQTKIYVGSVINPLKTVTANIITKMIINDGLKSPDYYFEWRELDTRDLDAMTKRFFSLFSMASMTPNQVRQKFGLEPYGEEGDQYYVSAQFMPVGEESVEKAQKRVDAVLAEILGKLKDLEEVPVIDIKKEE